MNTVTITIDEDEKIKCDLDRITIYNLQPIVFDGRALPGPFSLRFKNKALEGKPEGQWHESGGDKIFGGNVNVKFQWWYLWYAKYRKYDVRVPDSKYEILDPTIIIKRPSLSMAKFVIIYIAIVAVLGVGIALAFA